MSRRLALALPWLLAGFVVLSIVHDRFRDRPWHAIEDGAIEGGGEVEESGEPTAVDPVCSMTVARAASHSVDLGGRAWFFCGEACRDEFAADPGRRAVATPASSRAHTMRGVPTWMAQAGVAIVLVLSFGLFEFLSRFSARTSARTSRSESELAGRGARRQGTLSGRIDLTAVRLVRRALQWPPLVASVRFVLVALFLLVIAAGLFGNQDPAINVAPLLKWTLWWAGLVFLVLYLGKIWCTVCPWDAIATWIERLRFWGPEEADATSDATSRWVFPDATWSRGRTRACAKPRPTPKASSGTMSEVQAMKTTEACSPFSRFWPWQS